MEGGKRHVWAVLSGDRLELLSGPGDGVSEGAVELKSVVSVRPGEGLSGYMGSLMSPFFVGVEGMAELELMARTDADRTAWVVAITNAALGGAVAPGRPGRPEEREPEADEARAKGVLMERLEERVAASAVPAAVPPKAAFLEYPSGSYYSPPPRAEQQSRSATAAAAAAAAAATPTSSYMASLLLESQRRAARKVLEGMRGAASNETLEYLEGLALGAGASGRPQPSAAAFSPPLSAGGPGAGRPQPSPSPPRFQPQTVAATSSDEDGEEESAVARAFVDLTPYTARSARQAAISFQEDDEAAAATTTTTTTIARPAAVTLPPRGVFSAGVYKAPAAAEQPFLHGGGHSEPRSPAAREPTPSKKTLPGDFADYRFAEGNTFPAPVPVVGGEWGAMAMPGTGRSDAGSDEDLEAEIESLRKAEAELRLKIARLQAESAATPEEVEASLTLSPPRKPLASLSRPQPVELERAPREPPAPLPRRGPPSTPAAQPQPYSPAGEPPRQRPIFSHHAPTTPVAPSQHSQPPSVNHSSASSVAGPPSPPSLQSAQPSEPSFFAEKEPAQRRPTVTKREETLLLSEYPVLPARVRGATVTFQQPPLPSPSEPAAVKEPAREPAREPAPIVPAEAALLRSSYPQVSNRPRGASTAVQMYTAATRPEPEEPMAPAEQVSFAEMGERFKLAAQEAAARGDTEEEEDAARSTVYEPSTVSAAPHAASPPAPSTAAAALSPARAPARPISLPPPRSSPAALAEPGPSPRMSLSHLTTERPTPMRSRTKSRGWSAVEAKVVKARSPLAEQQPPSPAPVATLATPALAAPAAAASFAQAPPPDPHAAPSIPQLDSADYRVPERESSRDDLEDDSTTNKETPPNARAGSGDDEDESSGPVVVHQPRIAARASFSEAYLRSPRAGPTAEALFSAPRAEPLVKAAEPEGRPVAKIDMRTFKEVAVPAPVVVPPPSGATPSTPSRKGTATDAPPAAPVIDYEANNRRVKSNHVKVKLCQGGVFLKFSENSNPHKRKVYLSPNCTQVLWHDPKNPANINAFDAQSLTDVRLERGLTKKSMFSRPPAPDRVLSLVSPGRILDLEADTVEAAREWYNAWKFFLDNKNLFLTSITRSVLM